MNMYSNKFVTAIKVNGKVLREKGEQVFLPYQTEFSILLKNLNSRRVQVSVSIDGTDIAEGTQFIIDANSELEVKRFIRNGNLQSGNAFKFIPRTESVEEFRGIKSDDGIVRVEFEFEKEVIPVPNYKTYDIYPRPWSYPPYAPPPNPYWYHVPIGSTYLRGMAQGIGGSAPTGAGATLSSNSASINTFSTQSSCDTGITVPGSEVDQKFHTVSGFIAEDVSTVMILRLVGETAENKVVKAPVTVDIKPECITCGKVNLVNSKFCSNCGTALSLI